jgi:hypothetical protein
MGSASSPIIPVVSMWATLCRGKSMVKVREYFQVVTYIRVNGKMVKEVGRAACSTLMGECIKDKCGIVKKMVLVG